MRTTSKGQIVDRNRLLARLSGEEREHLAGEAAPTTLPFQKDLYGSEGPIDAVYFPLDCVVSVLVGAGEGARVEMATIGNEGVVGAFSLFSAERAIGMNLVQLPGDALRLDVARFKQHLKDSPDFDTLMHRYLFALTRQMVQAGACNQLHTMEERCARWLLLTHDRAGADSFTLTQEFLAEMLAVRRATVNLAIGMLRTAGFIRYVRGQITIVDRAGLESAACPCYELIRQSYTGLGLS